MHCSYAMAASKVTLPVDEEGADVEGAKEVRGDTVFIHVHFGRSWASLHLIVATSMAHITEKLRDLG